MAGYVGNGTKSCSESCCRAFDALGAGCAGVVDVSESCSVADLCGRDGIVSALFILFITHRTGDATVLKLKFYEEIFTLFSGSFECIGS